MPRTVRLVFDDRFLAYNMRNALMRDLEPYPFPAPIPHWSSPELVGRAKQLLDWTGTTDHLTPIAPNEATGDNILVYHTADYLAGLDEVERTGLDAGTGAPLQRGGLPRGDGLGRRPDRAGLRAGADPHLRWAGR